MSTSENGTRELFFGEAIREALAEELRRDPRVFMIGEDIAEAGTTFKVLDGLVQEFGPERILDSPISEPGITGLGVGAAMTGMRPQRFQVPASEGLESIAVHDLYQNLMEVLERPQDAVAIEALGEKLDDFRDKFSELCSSTYGDPPTAR